MSRGHKSDFIITAQLPLPTATPALSNQIETRPLSIISPPSCGPQTHTHTHTHSDGGNVPMYVQ